MNNSRNSAGLLLFISALLWILAAIISEGIDNSYTYSMPINLLGDGPAAPIFKGAFIIFGVSLIVSAYLIVRPLKESSFNDKLFWLLMTLTGIGALGIGIFNETFGLIHVFLVRMFWVLSIPTVIMSFKFQRKPFAYISIALGLLTLVATILFLSSVYAGPSLFLGITRGGMQRMIQYPIIIWALGFGALIAASSGKETKA